MASAKKTPAKTRTVEVEPARVVLELTQDEADYLRSLTGFDSGDNSWSIFQALKSVSTNRGIKALGPCMQNYIEPNRPKF